MKVAPLLSLVFWLLGGCAPDAGGRTPAAVVPGAGSSGSTSAVAGGKSAPPAANAPSYEVSIASAEADRVRARDLCDSKVKAERSACIEAAEAAYAQAKSAADTADNGTP